MCRINCFLCQDYSIHQQRPLGGHSEEVSVVGVYGDGDHSIETSVTVGMSSDQ